MLRVWECLSEQLFAANQRENLVERIGVGQFTLRFRHPLVEREIAVRS